MKRLMAYEYLKKFSNDKLFSHSFSYFVFHFLMLIDLSRDFPTEMLLHKHFALRYGLF